MWHVNFLSTDLYLHLNMKLKYVKTCKNETKLRCEENCTLIIY